MVRRLWTCDLVVARLMCKRPAISLFDNPEARSWTISTSRAVNKGWPEAGDGAGCSESRCKSVALMRAEQACSPRMVFPIAAITSARVAVRGM